MATCAIHRESKEHLPRRGDDIIEHVVPREFLVRRLIVPDAEPVKAGGDDAVGICVHEFITGELLADEMVVGLVVVESTNDVIAITPGIRLVAVALVAVRLGEADEVEPMPPPLFAVMGRGKQAIHERFPSLRRSIGDECLDLLRCRRQPREIVVNAPDERVFVGGRVGCDAFRFELREDKGIDRIRDRRTAFHRGHRGLFHRLKRPMRAILVRDFEFSLHRRSRRLVARRPRRAHLHPGCKIGDFRFAEFLLRRHLEVFVRPAHRLHEQALLLVAGDDRRSRVAALEQAGASVEQQAALHLVRTDAVALVAEIREHGAYALFKKVQARRRRFGSVHQCARQRGEEERSLQDVG